jgi:hypothetical protein
MPKYEVKKGQQGDSILFIDGMQSACPYVQPIPMQGNMGQIQIMRLPCTSICPLAEYDNKDTWKIKCGTTLNIYKIENEPETEVLDSKIIKLS